MKLPNYQAMGYIERPRSSLLPRTMTSNFKPLLDITPPGFLICDAEFSSHYSQTAQFRDKRTARSK